MTQLLEVSNLNKSYTKSDFNLSDISLSIAPGEVLGLIGKNGSGKSTLINTLVGNRFKDSGDIKFFGQSVTARNNQYKEHIGVVFDDLRVPNKLTLTDIDKVFTNIYTTWDSNKFKSTLKDFDLPTSNAIKSFSRGMRMKAAIAIALAHDSQLLILDEATAGMDVSGREEVMEILQDYVAKDYGIMISSHISEDIETLATKLVFMRNGKIVLHVDKSHLLSHYGIVNVPLAEFNVSNDYIIASRKRNDRIEALIHDRNLVPEAEPLKSIDDATKIIMRGDK